MPDWRQSPEYERYLWGSYSRDESYRRYIDRTAKESLEAREKADKCMAEYGPAVFCWPCAGICFEEEELKGERYGCAASLSCMFYGGMTTYISSTCAKSSAGLALGIPVLVIGTLCGMGMCARSLGCCQDCCKDAQYSSLSTARTVTQPGLDTSVVTTQPNQPSSERSSV